MYRFGLKPDHYLGEEIEPSRLDREGGSVMSLQLVLQSEHEGPDDLPKLVAVPVAKRRKTMRLVDRFSERSRPDAALEELAGIGLGQKRCPRRVMRVLPQALNEPRLRARRYVLAVDDHRRVRIRVLEHAMQLVRGHEAEAPEPRLLLQETHEALVDLVAVTAPHLQRERPVDVAGHRAHDAHEDLANLLTGLELQPDLGHRQLIQRQIRLFDDVEVHLRFSLSEWKIAYSGRQFKLSCFFASVKRRGLESLDTRID